MNFNISNASGNRISPQYPRKRKYILRCISRFFVEIQGGDFGQLMRILEDLRGCNLKLLENPIHMYGHDGES